MNSAGVSGPPAKSEDVTPLQHLQHHFGIADMSGEVRLVDLSQLAAVRRGDGTASLSFYGRADGALKMTRALEALPKKSTPKEVIGQFWTNPETAVFDCVAFTPRNTGKTTINLWVPPTVQPAKGGNWDRLKEFILAVISSGDEEMSSYILKFLAHMLQKPEEKPGILIVLLGGQGAGKGTFLRLLSRIWGRTTLLVSDVNQIVGTFNASLERHYVICMDEALFSGDKKAIERLKSLVTEPIIHVEQKYQPAHSIDSYHRFFATSNNDHFGQVDSDDRRFVFVRVSDVHKADAAYFDALHADIEDDTCMGAMVHDLLDLDLTAYNPRQRPRNKEHIRQKLQSLSGFDRYWYECLCLGTWPRQIGSKDWVPDFCATSELAEGFKAHDPLAQRFRPLQDDLIAARLKMICPSAKRTRETNMGRKQRGYRIPSLEMARREFEAHIGSSLDWDPPDSSGPEGQRETTCSGPSNARLSTEIQ